MKHRRKNQIQAVIKRKSLHHHRNQMLQKYRQRPERFRSIQLVNQHNKKYFILEKCEKCKMFHEIIVYYKYMTNSADIQAEAQAENDSQSKSEDESVRIEFWCISHLWPVAACSKVMLNFICHRPNFQRRAKSMQKIANRANFNVKF